MMEKSILLAFDDSENAMRAVEFTARSFLPDHRVMLFSVLPDIQTMCDMNNPSLTPYFVSEQVNFCGMEEKRKELMDKAMEKAKKVLIQSGFKEELIETKTEVLKKGVARDIVEEAKTGYRHHCHGTERPLGHHGVFSRKRHPQSPSPGQGTFRGLGGITEA